MINKNCIHYVGDEDCNKCAKHGLIASCGNCTDCDDGSVKEKPKHIARWIDEFCSHCTTQAITQWDGYGGETVLSRYCPKCGYYMVNGVDEW